MTGRDRKLPNFVLINSEDKVKSLMSASTSGGVGEAVASISIVCKRIFEEISSNGDEGAILDACCPARVREETESLLFGILE